MYKSVKKFYFFQEAVRLQYFEKQYCSRAAINITCSDMDSERLGEFCKEAETHTIPNGVDINYFSPNRETTEHNNRLIFI